MEKMMAHRIALVTDSTCDIPGDWVKQYEIEVVPLSIVFGGQPFLDGIEMTARDFYQRLASDPNHPTTSQPTPGAFLSAYKKAVEKGAEQVLVFTISSAMSGTVISARQAAEDSPIKVTVVDGKNNGMGLGWQVIAAARAREAGGGLPELEAAAEFVRDHMVYYVTLDTIDFLSRGGRIAGAISFVNSFLKIKPLIYVKPESGAVGASIPARSRKGALEGLYKEFAKHFQPGQKLHITVVHNNSFEEAQQIYEKLKAEFSPIEMFITFASPVLGAHTGPQAVGLIGYAE
jgi:DegV family protein with EDD domain